MIETLSIKNIALIEELSLDFSNHFTVLSGETGAGKSILIGAVSFLLGAKASVGIIRTGTSEASVAATLYIKNTQNDAVSWLESHGIPLEDNRVLIRRTIKTTGRGSIWIQNTPVSRTELAEFTAFLVDIHGQHDHQSLFKTAEHRKFLDSYAEITDQVYAFGVLYAQLAEIKAKRDELQLSEKERIERIDYLSFVIDEITAAQLQPDEDTVLEAEETKLCQYEKLYEHIECIDALCTQEQGVVPLLNKLLHTGTAAASIDETLEDYSSRIESAYYEMQDIAFCFASYREKLVFDPARLEQVQDRLSVIYKLKKKYGGTIQAVLEFAADAQIQLESLSEGTQNKAVLEQQIAALEAKLLVMATELSKKRSAAAEMLQKNVQDILQHLGMSKVVFHIKVTQKEQTGDTQIIGLTGMDTIEFLMSTNPGEPLRSLNKIASGGELSRVMLALKTVLAAADETDTLIFDEIDTGIGGEVAHAVAEHLKKLSKEKQILCITHLAVIAAHADTHIKIQKIQSQNSTVTRADTVTGMLRIDEIARMLAGDTISDASRSHAQELLSKYSGFPQ